LHNCPAQGQALILGKIVANQQIRSLVEITAELVKPHTIFVLKTLNFPSEGCDLLQDVFPHDFPYSVFLCAENFLLIRGAIKGLIAVFIMRYPSFSVMHIHTKAQVFSADSFSAENFQAAAQYPASAVYRRRQNRLRPGHAQR